MDAHDLNLCDEWVDDQDQSNWMDEADNLMSQATVLIRSLIDENAKLREAINNEDALREMYFQVCGRARTVLVETGR